ncbi:MAG: PLP-dependent aminotransferase family protein, partial [Betaproteobacteria bacterium]|nr:PLP-dependent aminotransferase family protein [Betaproteobacteria bacterium]
RRCIEQRIVIVPGALFTNTHRYGNCLRLSAGGRWTPEREQALRTVGRIACLMAGSPANATG